uniref:Ubiquinone biosynthesis monooxygenase COQ6, mitochondrial n=1 Tax=Plectus sambesii TaxID=2011161 RepID=A0A914VZ85_9BILA
MALSRILRSSTNLSATSLIANQLTRICRSFASTSSTSSLAASSDYYDVIVVGGGLVGNAMACNFGLNSSFKEKKLLLLEAGGTRSLGSPSKLYSNRVSAVSPSSKRLFQKLGIWDRLEAYRVKSVRQLQVMDSCSQSAIHFERQSFQSEVAWIIENDAMIGALFDKLASDCSKNVTVKSKARLKSCSLPADTSELAQVVLEDGSVFETKLIIGADGAKSKVREAMEIGYTGWEYGQKAIVATLQVSGGADNEVAWQRFTPFGPVAILPLSANLSSLQRFTPFGPVAILPLSANLSSLVWTTSPDKCDQLLALNEDEFVDQLNEALWSEETQDSFVNKALFTVDSMLSTVLPATSVVQLPPTITGLQSDSRAAFPLGFGHAHTYVKPRAALIGDAAHRVHPLAGQGVNLGWGDVQELIEVLQKVVRSGGDLGSMTSLAEYDSRRQMRNVPTMVAIDWLNRLYGTNFAPVVMARSLGLYGVNRFGALKNLIMDRASA